MNWPLEKFAGKDLIFVGAGKGRSMVSIQQFLEKYSGLASFTGVNKHDGEQPLAFLNGYDPALTVFIKNEGVPGQEMPVPYVTPMQIFFDLVGQTGATTIGITGTKGKSTTTALTAHVLQAAGKDVVLAGNIGIGSPVGALDQASDQTIFVLELSSYQLSDLTVSPHISACINLYNDHSDWHGTKNAYWEAKHNIMRYAGKDDAFIYNPDFPVLQDWAAAAHCRTLAINPSDELDLTGAQLFGNHNRLNALVARKLTHEFGITDSQFMDGLNSFEPLRHRMQFVARKNGLTYIDDAIGMTPESTMASLQAVSAKYGQIGCLLLGGQDRNYDFNDLMQQVAALEIPLLVLFPDTIAKMRAALPARYQPTIFEADDMSGAVEFAAAQAASESVVLLSTGAPSYSLWKDFEDKGDQFQAAVAAIDA